MQCILITAIKDAALSGVTPCVSCAHSNDYVDGCSVMQKRYGKQLWQFGRVICLKVQKDMVKSRKVFKVNLSSKYVYMVG